MLDHKNLLYSKKLLVCGLAALVFSMSAAVCSESFCTRTYAAGQSSAEIAARVNKAMAAARDQDFNTALELCNGVIADNPDISILYEKRAAVKWGMRKYVEALADIDKAISITPGHASFYKTKADILDEMNQKDAALNAIAYAIGLDPKAEYYIIQSNLYGSLGYYKASIVCAENALKLDSNNMMAYSLRGLGHKCIGNYSNAISDYTVCINKGYKLERAYINRADCYKSLKNYDAAIADYSKLAELKPNNFVTYYYRGKCYQAIKNNEAAKKDFNKVIEIAPDSPVAEDAKKILARL